MYVRHIKPYYEPTIFHFDSEMQARGWQRRMATELQRQYEVGYDARMSVKTSPEDGTYYMYWKTLEHVPGVRPEPFKIFVIDGQTRIWYPGMPSEPDITPYQSEPSGNGPFRQVTPPFQRTPHCRRRMQQHSMPPSGSGFVERMRLHLKEASVLV
ncbi:hypothetical protein TI39_contig52g00003 [Zymoseptoria brevis]|uniref:Uncharacterized protein n=1 Tax=Zymoseptoria brevis TaxID=1047168 RepID=A0A0F4H1Q4_9PEZI|nr:hypothetical protein TI39_contig52g00003 [Zymoseptoria brevis]